MVLPGAYTQNISVRKLPAPARRKPDPIYDSSICGIKIFDIDLLCILVYPYVPSTDADILYNLIRLSSVPPQYNSLRRHRKFSSHNASVFDQSHRQSLLLCGLSAIEIMLCKQGCTVILRAKHRGIARYFVSQTYMFQCINILFSLWTLTRSLLLLLQKILQFSQVLQLL